MRNLHAAASPHGRGAVVRAPRQAVGSVTGVFAAVLSLSALQAGAQRLPVPIVNHDNVVIEAPLAAS